MTGGMSLTFEVDEHFLVPKHILIPDQQVEEILKDLGISLEQIPQILKNDPSIKPMKTKKNDIIKIIRDSPTAGKTVYYRRVV